MSRRPFRTSVLPVHPSEHGPVFGPSRRSVARANGGERGPFFGGASRKLVTRTRAARAVADDATGRVAALIGIGGERGPVFGGASRRVLAQTTVGGERGPLFGTRVVTRVGVRYGKRGADPRRGED